MIKKSNYYKTEWWRERRIEALEDADHICDICGTKKNLHIHHKHYNSLFKEKEGDLVCLCKECHEDLHGRLFDLEDDVYD